MNAWQVRHLMRFSIAARLRMVVICAILAAISLGFGVQAAQDKTDAFKVGLIPDISGIDDNSFNSLAYQGLLRAQTNFGVIGSVYAPALPDQYSAKLQQCVSDGNDLCIGVGFLLTNAVEAAALAYPGTRFAIIDASYASYPSNLRGILFAVEEAGYLAGVLAANLTDSQIIGAIGGMQIPPVDRFIYGYRQGAICSAPAIQTMISYTGDFTDPVLGAEYAVEQLNQGADVIFAVAGSTNIGIELRTTFAQKWAIGVDVDNYYTIFDGGAVDGAEYLLTSAVKRVDNAVYATIADLVAGTFTSGEKEYDLESDGVGLAPFHEADAAVPQSVRDALASVQQDIINGLIDPLAPCLGQLQVGLVSSSGGFDDQSFNMMAYQGLWRAQNELGVFIRTYEPSSDDEYSAYITECVSDGNDLCMGVGFLLSDAIAAAALAYPWTNFAIIDVTYDTYPDNLCGTYFAADEASYLGGVLAASMPGVDALGVIGVIGTPAVLPFIGGFITGARCAAPDMPIQVFYVDDFNDPDLGFQIAQDQIEWGADVIFPVAGGTSVGAVNAAIQAQVWAMGVDADFYYSMFGGVSAPGTEYLLTSVMKRVDNAVFAIIADMKNDGFSSGTRVYNLANQGVGLAPYHDADAAVPGVLRSYLALLEKDIIAGNINTENPCSYYIFAPLLMK